MEKGGLDLPSLHKLRFMLDHGLQLTTSYSLNQSALLAPAPHPRSAHPASVLQPQIPLLVPIHHIRTCLTNHASKEVV